MTVKEATGFHKAIAVYFGHATKTGGRRNSVGAGSKSDYCAKDVRVWAKAQGIGVADRGRIPGDVVARWNTAN
ncbi:histone-like nucleoid-structuring protein Lsr2 [Nocardioides sp. Root1257]|uniref:Lsr2 family DNA-binding protein n=1 Tax=unclassified Nocardioides TaxID=2615069 RepID=UPI0039E05A54